jgi:hypothetical protein
MPYTLKADNNVICQCGCIVNKYYMSKHLQTAKHIYKLLNMSAKWLVEKISKYLITINTTQESNVNFFLNNINIKRYLKIKKNKK